MPNLQTMTTSEPTLTPLRLGEAADVADSLPPASREIFVGLRDRTVDTHGSVLRLSDEVSELRGERDRLRSRIAQLHLGAGHGGHGLSADDPIVARETNREQELTRKLASLIEKQSQRGATWHELGRLIDACEKFIVAETAAGHRLREHPPVRIDSKGDAAEAIIKLREQIAKLRSELEVLEQRPVPLALSKARLRDEIGKLAELGRPDLRALLTPEGGAIVWPEQTVKLKTWKPYSEETGGQATGELFHSLALLAYLHQSQIVAALEKDLAALMPNEGIDDAARAKEAVRLQAKILETERLECGLIARSNGEYRADCDPRAVLVLM